MKYLQDCSCIESEHFINDDNTPYCRWCGINFKTNIMKANLEITQEDLKVLFAHTKSAYKNMSFENWKKESLKSYMSYFNNKDLFNNKKYNYSQFVNAQVMALQY